MIITIPWLKEHLKTNAKETEIISQLTNIGLEVEGVKENSGEMAKFKIAKVLKAEKHPNADKLSSFSEQSIPFDSIPLIFATFNSNFVFGIIAPGGA